MAKEVEYDQFKDLWKLDDEDWIKERTELWNKISVNFFPKRKKVSAKVRKCVTDCFLEGKYLPKYNKDGVLERVKVSGIRRMFCIPWETREDVRRVFETEKSENNQREILSMLPSMMSHWYLDVPNYEYRIRNLCTELLGNEHRPIYFYNVNNAKIDVAPDALDWANNYLFQSIKLLSGKYGQNYFYVVDTFDYFISCLNHIEQVDDELISYTLELKCLCNTLESDLLSQYQSSLYNDYINFFQSSSLPAGLEKVSKSLH